MSKHKMNVKNILLIRYFIFRFRYHGRAVKTALLTLSLTTTTWLVLSNFFLCRINSKLIAGLKVSPDYEEGKRTQGC